MIEKWLNEEIEGKLNYKHRIVIKDQEAKWKFLVEVACKSFCVLCTSDADASSKWEQKKEEMFLRYNAEKNHAIENVVFYVTRELLVDSFLAEYGSTGGTIDLSLEWVREKLVKKTGSQVSLSDEELFIACQLGVNKDLNWWKRAVQKLEPLLNLEADILDFLDAPDVFMLSKTENVKKLYIKEICSLLGQPYQEKPYETYAKEIANHVLNGIVSGDISAKEYSIYNKWIDSREHEATLKKYLASYQLPSNLKLEKVKENHCFETIDKKYLIRLIENINDKNKVKEILEVAKKRISYQKANPYIAPWWIDVLTLMQYNFQCQGHTLDEVSNYYTMEFACIDRSMRHLLSFFKADKNIMKPLQEHYDRLNQDLLNQWFSHKGNYHDNQHGYLVNLFKNASKKIAVIVGDALRYEVADSVVQHISSDIKVKKKLMYAGLPSETEHNMSALYTTSDTVIAEKKEREKILLKESGKNITFMQLEDVNSTTDAELLVLTYKDIDDAGEKMQQSALRLFDEFVELLEQKIDLLLHIGYKEVHLVTDHGFVLTGLLEEADKIPTDDIKGNKKVSERYIYSDEEPIGDKYLTLKEQKGAYNYVCFAKSSRPFVTTGKYGYSHGGFTPQEVVIPNFVFTYEQINQMDVNITNKKDLIDFSGNLLTIKFASSNDTVDLMSSLRKVRVVLYVNDQVVDKSSIISMTLGATEKVELALDNAEEATVIIYDEDSKDQLDKAKVKKMQMRDLGGLL